MQEQSIVRIFSRPILWLLIYGAVLAYGVYALMQIPVEVLPRFNYPQVSITAHYPGATPEEMETLVARPIEGQILGTRNLVSLHTVMGQGGVQITARFGNGSSAQQDLQVVYSAIARARGQLPPGIQPQAEIMGSAINEVADYAVAIPPGVAPVQVQKAIKTRILPALRALPGVQRVEVFGSGDESLWVQPDPRALRRYGVSLATITEVLRQQVVLGPAGRLVLGHQDVLIEARYLPQRVDELRDILIPAYGGNVPLGKLARIVRAPLPIQYAVALDGQPSIALLVFKQPGASTIPVTHAVARTLQQLADQLPSGAKWTRINSQGHLVGLIGSDLGRNLIVGGLLAVIMLFLIMGVHRGVWVLALSVPMALLIGIAGLYISGQTLNLLTLGALSVAVGLLADDGIIVLESIYHRWEQGDIGSHGVWAGVKDIAAPDITGTLTTVSVYLPLLLVGGLAGLFFLPFALAMSLSLLASLAISLSVIPLLLARMSPPVRWKPASGARFVAWLQHRNKRLLNFTLRYPRASLTVSALLLAFSIGVLLLVPINFLPLPNEGVLLDSFTLPPGTSLVQTRKTVARITEKIRSDPAVAHTFARIGSAQDTAYTERSFAGEIQVVLKPGVAVQSLDRLSKRLLSKASMEGVQQSYGTPTLERLGESLSGLPQPFVITLLGSRVDTLRKVSEQMVARLRHVPALADIFNNDAYPVTQLRIQPRPQAMALYGITPKVLYAQIKPALDGIVLARIPQGDYHLALYLRLAHAPDFNLGQVRRLLIHTTKGWSPLGQLAQVSLVTGPNQIRHLEGARAIDILATPQGPLGSTIAAARAALHGMHLPTGYRFVFGGLYPRLEHAAIILGIAAIGALLLLLGILVLQFDGLLIPGILILEIPLAFTGGALALGVSGVGLNATGLVGFLTIIGISLNHGIVLLHRVRRSEKEGMDPEAAVREAVQVRFRPILLTTLTAVLGMLPTALGWGLGAEPEQGLAIVVLGGIIWSSMLSTNLVPALYLWRLRHRAASSSAG
ncbi:MAG TPA: AcrB/AcrD/AcrF family protein [Gammaproteobacteria bacterium]|nr:AcrB/AcrD/AcrF family protein [Gammaproteobacteria bacterium]